MPASRKKMQNPDAKPPTASDLRAARLDKVTAMLGAGVEPYAYSFSATDAAATLQQRYKELPDGADAEDGKEIAIAGRIVVHRVFGKLAFFTLQDASGTIQLYLDKKHLDASMGAGSFANLMAWTDGSDIIGVRGTAKRTEKGELSVKVAHWQMLTKSLTPLPDTFHGFTDVEKRYRATRFLPRVLEYIHPRTQYCTTCQNFSDCMVARPPQRLLNDLCKPDTQQGLPWRELHLLR